MRWGNDSPIDQGDTVTNTLEALAVPLIQAPMAGGPSNAALAVAVSRAGGLGMLAAGYKTVEAMAAEIDEVRAGTLNFGVNVFVLESDPSDPHALTAYATALAPMAAELGVAAPEPGPFSDDHYAAKIDYLVANPVPLVSFTFGLPSADDVARLRSVGTEIVLNATDPEEISAADALNPDAIVVQGTEAGGHRATHGQAKEPSESSTHELVSLAREYTDKPVIAAGGVTSAAIARNLFGAGASAVQVGTLFLTAQEAGTKEAHKDALVSGQFRNTVMTRTFSGRAARALSNRFTERMAADQVVGYPQVHYMTAPLRAASADNPEGLNLWAGTGFAACQERTAAEIVDEFRSL